MQIPIYNKHTESAKSFWYRFVWFVFGHFFLVGHTFLLASSSCTCPSHRYFFGISYRYFNCGCRRLFFTTIIEQTTQCIPHMREKNKRGDKYGSIGIFNDEFISLVAPNLFGAHTNIRIRAPKKPKEQYYS
jgi:hypothetical protein